MGGQVVGFVANPAVVKGVWIGRRWARLDALEMLYRLRRHVPPEAAARELFKVRRQLRLAENALAVEDGFRLTGRVRGWAPGWRCQLRTWIDGVEGAARAAKGVGR